MQSAEPAESDHANLYWFERSSILLHVNIPGVKMRARLMSVWFSETPASGIASAIRVYAIFRDELRSELDRTQTGTNSEG